ncbi:MAG: superoxide dismutase [Lachnospiraceae bacterium]|nr:superoxide dismutase [Lachnospiraceae bacterium]
MFQQYQLPYAYDALEPVIDATTMETHHSKHHATYTATLNKLAEEAGVLDQDITSLLANLNQISDEKLRNGIRNNGGGFYNHNLYFSIMAPACESAPTGALKEKMDATFGNFDAFVEKISALATGQFGSGWAWMSVTKDGDLVLSNSANQDNPISLGTGNTPIFAIDVWEHAYYLKFKNLRAAYVKEFFKVVDWKKVGELYEAACK